MTLDLWTLIDDDSIATEDLSGFQYKEAKESGAESYSPTNSQATRVFYVNWEDRADFLDYLLGSATLNSSYGIYRELPDEHPEINNFFALEAGVQGMGIPSPADSGNISWTIAKITANYRPVPYAVLDDSEVSSELQRFVSRQYTFNADYLSVAGSMAFVLTGLTPPLSVLNTQPGRITGTRETTYTFHKVPALPNNPFEVPNITAITNLYGKVNSVAFDGNPIGTCLFIGCDPVMTMPLLGDTGTPYYWDIAMKVLVRNNGTARDGNPAGHNYFYYLPLGQWVLVTSDGTSSGQPVYQSGDLNGLFVVG